MSEATTKTVNLTTDALKELVSSAVTAAVAEARKPVVTEADQKRIEQQQEERRANAADIKKQAEHKALVQKLCNHMQDRGRDASRTACVYIPPTLPENDNGNYLICQACQKIIRPKGEDLQIFNQHFQMQRRDF